MKSKGPHRHAMQVILPLGSKPDKRAGKDPEGDSKDFPPGGKCVEGVTGELLCIRKPPEPETVRRCTLSPSVCVAVSTWLQTPS